MDGMPLSNTKQIFAYSAGTVIMGIGWMGLQVPWGRNDPMIFETCCFLLASVLLAIPLSRLFRFILGGSFRLGLMGLWVAMQEALCLYGLSALILRIVEASK